MELQKAQYEIAAAVQRNDGQTALTHAASIPDFQVPMLLFLKGRAHLLVNDYSSAETEFRRTLLYGRNLANFGFLRGRFPAVEILTHYYLGQLSEPGKRDQAISEYQEFLSYFESSHTRLPEVGEARTGSWLAFIWMGQETNCCISALRSR